MPDTPLTRNTGSAGGNEGWQLESNNDSPARVLSIAGFFSEQVVRSNIKSC